MNVTPTDKTTPNFVRRVLSLPTLIAFLVGLAVLALALWRILDFEWTEFRMALFNSNLGFLVLAGALYYLSFLSRGIRWRIMARNAGLGNKHPLPNIASMSAIILSGWFLNAVGFLRVGDAYRGWALAKRTRTSSATSLGTVAAERAQDIVIVLILLVVSGLWLFATQNETSIPPQVIYASLTLATVLTIGLLVVVVAGEESLPFFPQKMRAHHTKAVQSINNALDAHPSTYANTILKGLDFFFRFRKGLLTSIVGKHITLQIVLGLIGWLLEATRFYFVAQALGFEVTLPLALIVALAIAMLTTIPTPGGFGFVETGLLGLLILLNFTTAEASALVVGDRLISWISVIIIGGATFFITEYPHARKSRLFSGIRRTKIKNSE